MALVKCPECGKEVSDKAGKCPQCGFPIYLEINNSLVKKKCSFCGAINEHYLSNCKNCNGILPEVTKTFSDVGNNTFANQYRPHEVHTNQKKKESIIGIVGMIISMFGLLGFPPCIVIGLILCIIAIANKNHKSICGIIGLSANVLGVILTIILIVP